MDKKEIKVTYDGGYLNVCRGRLVILAKEKETNKVREVYNKRYRCDSTGSAGCEGREEFCNSGKLVWKDRWIFSQEIQEAVDEVLDTFNVCCGGCI